MAYWALQANPSRYRILQAVLDFDETTWTANQYADQIQAGDQILMWLSGPNSGGYALGEVTAAATVMPEDPRFVPYWTGAGGDDDAKALPRIRVRFTRRMYLHPLLRTQCKEDPVLSQMHIMRQAAGTIFKITDKEWQRVQESTPARPTDWTREELLLALALYFDVRDKRLHEPEESAIASLTRMLDRDAQQMVIVLRRFAFLDPHATGDVAGGVTEEMQAVWYDVMRRPDHVRQEATRIHSSLLAGGGLARVREAATSTGSAGNTTEPVEQRKDPAFARERMEHFLPDAKVREICLRVIADTIERAHALGQACWGVTLRKSKKIHLNVGRYLGIGVYEGRIFLGLYESEMSDDLRAFLMEHAVKTGTFESLKGSWTGVFPAERFIEIWSKVEKPYWRFVEEAAKTAKQTPWFYSHSPGFVVYLREVLNRPNLPEPVYDWTARRPPNAEEDDDEAPEPAKKTGVTSKLTLVTTLDDIRQSIARFNAQAVQAGERARSLLRSTTYWVFDPSTGQFGPSKFVGFAGIDFATYETATKGETTGASFDGHTTRTAIEKASSMAFSSDPHLSNLLRKWGEALLGAGVFERLAEGPSKWKFLALPASDCRYWKIAPGEQAAFWEENLKSGMIAIGWGQAGDPRPYKSKEELEAHHRKIFNYTKDQAQNNVRMVWCFTREIKPGDIVVANRGQSRVTGRGVVLGPAEFRAERGEYGNCLPVHWFDQKGRDVARQKSWFTTILPIAAEVYEALFGAIVDDEDDLDSENGGEEQTIEPEVKPSIYDFLRKNGFHFPAELVTTYLLSLQTKPFVVLSGISGTGKTKLAQAVAEYFGVEFGQYCRNLARATRRGGTDAPDDAYESVASHLQPFAHESVFIAQQDLPGLTLPLQGSASASISFNGKSFEGTLVHLASDTYELRFTPELAKDLAEALHDGDALGISASHVGDEEIELSLEPIVEGAHRNRAMVVVRRHEFVSVRPDWLDGKEVLGFYNVLTEDFASRPFLNLLLKAHREPSKPHFAILDEMNLARVEHYFADLLSATESRTTDGDKLRQEPLHLHDQPKCLPLAAPEDWVRPERCGTCRATEAEIDACPLHLDGVQLVPPKFKVPPNVYITGTVNIDETTHMFSPKVLDRANVIEFNEVDLLGYGNGAAPGEFVFQEGRIDLGASTVARQEHFLKAPEEVRKPLTALNQILADYHLHFGYRVANEIALYVKHAVESVGPGAIATALDLQVLQKVLPKFHGSKQKLLGPLWRVLLFTIFGRDLGTDFADDSFVHIESAIRKGEAVAPPAGGEALKPAMPRSAAKLVRMLRTLRAQGFVSFIE